MEVSEKNAPKNQRIEYVDALKGLAIFFVIWGHSLQYLKGKYDFYQNPMFEFIYSFHMPLFFMVSGFFFRSSLRQNLKDFLYKKGIQLLLPCVVWAVIFFLIRLGSSVIHGNHYDLNNWVEELKTVFFPGRWLWFLRELFISYFIVYVFLKLFKKDWLACLLSIGFVIIAPYLGIQRLFLPIFWAGIYLKNNLQFISKYATQILLISFIVFAVCLLFWDGSYMHVSVLRIFEIRTLSFDFSKIGISLFHLAIGLSGSLFWFMLFKKIYRNNAFFVELSKIGTNTLAIYVLQALVLETSICTLVDFSDMNSWIYNLVVTPLIALVVLGICLLIIKFVQKNKYVELLLFGKRY